MKLKMILVFFIGISTLLAQNPNDVPFLVKTSEKEITRVMNELKTQQYPPYFLSYFITDSKTARITSTLGVIRNSNKDSLRMLDIQIRVGNYKFDNTHLIRGNPLNFSSSFGRIELPQTDDDNALANRMWFSTDKAYKNAIERFEKAITNTKVKVQEDDTSSDFSIEKPIKFIEKGKFHEVDLAKFEPILERLSAKFIPYKWILNSSVSLIGNSNRKTIVSSEGTQIQSFENYFYIYVNASTKAEDGMSLPLYRSYFAFTPDSLPNESVIAKSIDEIISLLDKLRKAPYAETFTGPAMLSGRASGVFFHEIFGHRVEGHREKDPNSSQTFKKSVGEKILPDFMNISFDPTRRILNNTLLAGFYNYDDEGIKAEKVEVVKDGVFSDFLMSRTPIEGFSHSNGHGRKSAGYSCVTRQSNLIVEGEKTNSIEEVKTELRKIAKEQGKEYGLYFDDVSGGFTFTERSIPNAFNVTPLVVYKVYVDGRPDELVRGVDLIGTPLTTFANIVAVGNDMDTFNGVCGAESGGVPVSASSPTILVSRIEVQKKLKSQAKPPILTAP
jgi:predicted Zn-dependent protease